MRVSEREIQKENREWRKKERGGERIHLFTEKYFMHIVVYKWSTKFIGHLFQGDRYGSMENCFFAKTFGTFPNIDSEPHNKFLDKDVFLCLF